MAPVDNSPRGNMSGFELVCSLKANESIPVYKYKSTNTGITVFIAEIDGPIVDGDFCIVTEAHDDDGLPHTLEHLIFLGSEEYPYKGILDLWANRCYASGTNAHTDTDNTLYTMETAGSEGFLSLMPVYLDHILYPLLRDAGYLTEVHHITGTGEDAGVVYCEMQGAENVAENLTYIELSRTLYPGDCGYKSVTGGMLKNLRESTSNKKVRDYHKAFYRPENLTIMIMGQVKHADVFKALQPLEEKIMSKGPRGPFQRPWQSPIEPFVNSVDIDVHYPSDCEDNGMVHVGWRGPRIAELYEHKGLDMLLKYLTMTAISPLSKEFVEIEDPYASNVAFSIVESAVSCIYIGFAGVPLPKIPLVKDLMMKVLNNVYDNENSIDMTRMKTILHKELLQILVDMENSPHSLVGQMLLADAIYGNTKEDLEERLNDLAHLKKLETEPKSYWLNLLKKYLIDAPMVTVRSIPSIEKQKELTQQEKERVQKQVENLGKEGLERKEKELLEAKAENDRPIPEELLATIPSPSIDSIKFHSVKSFNSNDLEQHPRFDVTKLPLYTILNHINTNFVHLCVLMDSSSLEAKYRPYIPLLFEVFLESPVNRDGEVISYEQVVTELEGDTLSLARWVGFASAGRFSCGTNSHMVAIYAELELAKYEKGVQWMKELLYDSILTPERLKVIAMKTINEVSDRKRNGHKVVEDLMREIYYDKNTNPHASGMLRQYKFLTKLVERLNTEEGQKEAIADMEHIRKILTSAENMALYISVNADKLASRVPDVYAPWEMLASKLDTQKKTKFHTVQDWTLFKSPSDIVDIKGCVTGLGCVDSTFMLQTCPCINDELNPDVAPLFVCLQYLTQLEGPMWRSIRGRGLSYSYSITPLINDGLLYLLFYKATNLIEAYKEAKSIVEKHLNEGKWDKFLFESAKASSIYAYIESEKNIGSITFLALTSYLGNVPLDYNHKMVQLTSAVTIEDMNRVASRYLKPLFDPAQCKTTVICHPSKISEIAEAFKELNHDLKIYNTLEETYLNEC